MEREEKRRGFGRKVRVAEAVTVEGGRAGCPASVRSQRALALMCCCSEKSLGAMTGTGRVLAAVAPRGRTLGAHPLRTSRQTERDREENGRESGSKGLDASFGFPTLAARRPPRWTDAYGVRTDG